MKQDRTCCDGLCEQGRSCPLTAFQARNDLHRHFAPGVIDGYRPPMSRIERALLAAAFVVSAVVVCMLLGWGYQELR